jgi:hypothetical protein
MGRNQLNYTLAFCAAARAAFHKRSERNATPDAKNGFIRQRFSFLDERSQLLPHRAPQFQIERA